MLNAFIGCNIGCREVLAAPLVLNLPNQINWKSCLATKNEETKAAQEMRKNFEPLKLTFTHHSFIKTRFHLHFCKYFHTMISYIPQSVLYVLLLGLVHLVMFCAVVIIRVNNFVKKLIVVHQYASTILM